MIALFGCALFDPWIALMRVVLSTDLLDDVASASDVRTFIIPYHDHDDGEVDRPVIGGLYSHEICGDLTSFRCFLSFLFVSA